MNSKMQDSSAVKDKLVSDFRALVSSAEELLRATASQAGDRMADARARFQDSLEDAKVMLANTETMLTDKTRDAARATDQYVHDNPWKAVAASAFVGLLLGLLMGSGDDSDD